MLRSTLPPAVLALLTLIGAANQAQAQTSVGACVERTKDIVVCGSGPNPLIVLDKTTSPSGALAIAWRSKGPSRGELSEPEGVENHLVRLSDGLLLSEVVGRSWADEGGRGNHIHHTVAWSPDSHWLVVGDSSKWALEAIAIYAIDPRSTKVAYQGLFRKMTSATQAALRTRKRRDEYALDIANDKGIAVTNSGAVSVPVIFQIPKEGHEVELTIRFKAGEVENRVEVSPLTVSPTKN